MRTTTVSFVASVLLVLCAAVSAQAAPTTVNVRIEGKSETLFEGPVETEGHAIEAASEGAAHVCDGTNEHKHPAPGATPTAAAADAMSIVGETFDGIWEKEDFKITRWGPDSANVFEGEFWGVLVDQELTSVGGCQVELAPGDEVLWMYNTFAGDPFLTLYSGSEPAGSAVASASAEVGKPLTLSVGEYTSSEGAHHAVKPFTAGAEVSPVLTGEHDFQKVETTSAESVTTGASGEAQITFQAPGWHRLKATAGKAFRSNRLDVCVQPCGPLPADDGVRSIVPGTEPPAEEPPAEVKPGEETRSNGTNTKTETQTSQAPPAPLTGVSGSTASAPAQLRLGGMLLTPLDDRAAALSYRGRWRRISEAGAWQHTLTVGGAGASMSVHLARGRPVLIVRDVHHRARVAVQLGARHEQLTIAASASGASRPLLLPRRSVAGTVTLRIISGTVGIDGVALSG